MRARSRSVFGERVGICTFRRHRRPRLARRRPQLAASSNASEEDDEAVREIDGTRPSRGLRARWRRLCAASASDCAHSPTPPPHALRSSSTAARTHSAIPLTDGTDGRVVVRAHSVDAEGRGHRRGVTARLLPDRVLLHPPPPPPPSRARCSSRAAAARCNYSTASCRRGRVVAEVARRAGAASPTPRLGTAAPGSRAAASAPAAAARPPTLRFGCGRGSLQ